MRRADVIHGFAERLAEFSRNKWAYYWRHHQGSILPTSTGATPERPPTRPATPPPPQPLTAKQSHAFKMLSAALAAMDEAFGHGEAVDRAEAVAVDWMNGKGAPPAGPRDKPKGTPPGPGRAA